MHDRDQLNAASGSAVSSQSRPLFTQPALYLDLLITYTKQEQYSELKDLIIIYNDFLQGVISHADQDLSCARYPTGFAIIRDATVSGPRLQFDHPIIAANTMLLRTLSMMCSINWVLGKKVAEEVAVPKILRPIQQMLKVNFIEHVRQIQEFQSAVMCGEIPQKNLYQLGMEFKQVLKNTLIAAGLDEGISREDEFQELLLYYQYLASTLDPARSVITKQKYNYIIHVEEAHPITEKTLVQLEQLHAKLLSSTQKAAFRIANAYFHELMIRKDRRLPAQAEKTMGVALTEAYRVRNDFDDTALCFAQPFCTAQYVQDLTDMRHDIETAHWLQQQLKDNEIDITLEEIQRIRALGLHKVFLAALAVFGREEAAPVFSQESTDIAHAKLNAAYQGALYQISFGDISNIVDVLRTWAEKALAYQESKSVAGMGVITALFWSATQRAGRVLAKESNVIPRADVNELLNRLRKVSDLPSLGTLQEEVESMKSVYSVTARGIVFNQLAELLDVVVMRARELLLPLDTTVRGSKHSLYGDL